MADVVQKNGPATIWDHLALMLKWKKFLMIGLIIISIASVTYALLAKKWYMAEARVLPPPPQQMLGFGGLVPNLDLGFIGGIGTYSDEMKLVVTVLESRRIKDKVIERFNWIEEYNLPDIIEAYGRYLKTVKYNITDEGSLQIISEEEDPVLAAETVNFIVDELATEFNKITVAQARSQREFLEKRLDKFYAELDALEDSIKVFQEETGAIVVDQQVEATVSLLATIKGELILAEVTKEVYEETLPPNSSKLIAASLEVARLQKEVDNITANGDKEGKSLLIGLDDAPELAVKSARLMRTMELQSKILEFLLPQYEQAKIAESREKGDIYILDRAVPPVKKFKPRRAILVIALVLLGFLILYCYILFVEWLNRLKEANPDHFEYVENILVGLKPKNLFSFKEENPRK